MAWIESHQTLARHPKTIRAAQALGISRVQVIGHLHFLWWWCLDYADEGSLDGLSDLEIAAAAEWDGDAEAFTLALTRAGFLEADDTGTLHIHDWQDYAGRLLDQRERNAAKQRRYRARQGNASKENRENNPAVTVRDEDVTVTYPSHNPTTKPNQTRPNQTESEIPRDARWSDESPEIATVESITQLTGEQPYDVLATFAGVIGTDLNTVAPAWRKKQLAVAKRLLEEGYGADKVRRYVLFRLSETWRNGSPFDLFNIEKEIGTWEASGSPERAPARNGIRPTQADFNQPRRNPDGTLRAVH